MLSSFFVASYNVFAAETGAVAWPTLQNDFLKADSMILRPLKKLIKFDPFCVSTRHVLRLQILRRATLFHRSSLFALLQ